MGTGSVLWQLEAKQLNSLPSAAVAKDSLKYFESESV